ncbi:MAG: DUF6788 family protein [Egibacteraceae bacterium]
MLPCHTCCGSPGCRCHADPPQPHGPYYQWTAKANGKTVTRRLTEHQARPVQGMDRQRPAAPHSHRSDAPSRGRGQRTAPARTYLRIRAVVQECGWARRRAGFPSAAARDRFRDALQQPGPQVP